MTKPMKYRELAKLLREAGFAMRQGKGDHEKWYAPDGTHVTIVHATTISPASSNAVISSPGRRTVLSVHCPFAPIVYCTTNGVPGTFHLGSTG